MKHFVAFALSVFAMAAIARPVNSMLGAENVERIVEDEGIVQVEYLESTGSQYIDTGLNSTYDGFCDFEIAFRKTVLWLNPNPGNQEYYSPFGYQYAISARYGLWAGTSINDKNLYVGINQANQVILQKDTEWHEVRVFNGRYVDVDGEITAVGTGSVRSNIGLFLFATITSANGASTFRIVPSQISYCKIYNKNGELLRDYVPVRFDGVGYMLDLLSGELYGNEGEGEFIVGPDKE